MMLSYPLKVEVGLQRSSLHAAAQDGTRVEIRPHVGEAVELEVHARAQEVEVGRVREVRQHRVDRGLDERELAEVAGERGARVEPVDERRRPLRVERRLERAVGDCGDLPVDPRQLQLEIARCGRRTARRDHQGSARYGKWSRNSLSFLSGFGGVLGWIGAASQSA
jgi:hypothetical protein